MQTGVRDVLNARKIDIQRDHMVSDFTCETCISCHEKAIQITHNNKNTTEQQG